MILIVGNKDILDEIGALPQIEDDGGEPVLIGTPVQEAAPGTRYAIAHPFSELQLEWLEAYTSGENPKGQIVEKLPSDWKYPVTP